MAATKILVFAGSIRSTAFSGRLAAVAAKELAILDAEVSLISLADYPLPIFDADLERGKGLPENALKLARLLAGHAGIFIATPEYNHSLPPLLKNTIDWVSRPKSGAGLSLRGRVYAIGGVSDGPVGGARALVDLRKVLAAAFDALVIPDQIALGNAQDAFNEAGNLIDPGSAGQLRRVASALVEMTQRLGVRRA